MAPTYGPQSFLNTGRADTARFVQAGVSNLATFAMKEYLKQATAQATAETQKDIAIIATVYSAAVQQQWRKNVDKINQRVGEDAQRAMLRRYDATREEDNTGPYRSQATGNMRRYAGGVLRNALASPAMFKATKDGIVFGNPEWLDSKARQWARLNFGAGAKANSGIARSREVFSGSGSSRVFEGVKSMNLPSVQSPTVRFLGTELNIDLGGPRPTWVVPAGLWTSRDVYGKSLGEASAVGPGSVFTPLGGLNASTDDLDGTLRRRRSRLNYQGRAVTASKVSKGVAARGFLEAGAGSIARNLPIAGVSYLLKIFEDSTDQAVNTIPNKKALEIGQINSAINILSKELEASLARLPSGPQRTARGLSTFVRGL